MTTILITTILTTIGIGFALILTTIAIAFALYRLWSS